MAISAIRRGEVFDARMFMTGTITCRSQCCEQDVTRMVLAAGVEPAPADYLSYGL